MMSSETGEVRKFVTSQECGHLKVDGEQVNAYYVSGKLCCMCGIGTKWEGDCNSTHPNSTKCEKCHFNPDDKADREYMPYGPHIRPECFPQLMSSCVKPKELFEGSITEKAKCVCPAGMIEKHRQCFKETPAAVPTVKSSIRTKITQNMIPTTTRTTVPATTTVPQSTHAVKKLKIPDKIIQSPQTTVMSDKITTGRDFTGVTPPNNFITSDMNNSSNIHQGMPVWLGAVLGPCVIIFVICGIVFLICKYKSWNERKSNNNKAQGSNQSTPTSSRSDLLSSRHVNIPVLQINDTFAEGANVPNEAGPIRGRGIQEHAITHEPCAPEAQGLLRAEVDDNRREEFINFHPEFTREQCEKFAKDLATKFWTRIGHNQVEQVYRKLFSTNHDNVIESLKRKYGFSLDFVYHLMVAVHQNLGHKLTPRYILTKLEEIEPRPGILINITQDALNDWRPDLGP